MVNSNDVKSNGSLNNAAFVGNVGRSGVNNEVRSFENSTSDNSKKIINKSTENIQIGQIVEGKVVRLAKYGVFVSINNGQNVGLIHISEVTDAYIKDVGRYFQIGDIIRVKVIGKSNDGKIALSTKQVEGSTLAEKIFNKAKSSQVNLDKVVGGRKSYQSANSNQRHNNALQKEKLEVLLAKFNKDSAPILQKYQERLGGKNDSMRRKKSGDLHHDGWY